MKYILYNHIGSANHGCEALVRTIAEVFGVNNTILLSEAPEEEKKYGVAALIDVKPALLKNAKLKDFITAYLRLKIKKDYFPLDVLPYKKAIRKLASNTDVIVSIGGDIYCYDNYPKYILLHQYVNKYIKKSILVGCSIEEESLKDIKLLNDLKTYNLISARESLTYSALKSAGLNNVIYCPDTAFALKAEEIKLPCEFIPGKTVGFNISPLVLNKSRNGELLLNNYFRAVDYLLENTDFAIAFIPHVAWEDNNDSVPLNILYQKYRNNTRVCILPDLSATKAKYCISKCKFFVGARTHATIAAYSSCVPTVVLGYSVKSKGIAKDLFGTDEHYVIDYKKIDSEFAIVDNLCWVMENEKEIITILEEKNKEYFMRIGKLKGEIEKQLG